MHIMTKSPQIPQGGTLTMEYSSLPKDPMVLLSFINTKLRDDYPSLDELCSSLCVNADDIKSKLASIDYSYDAEKNRFV